MIKGLLLVTSIALLAFIAVTYLALESGGVVTVETSRSSGGETRSTHIWYIEHDGTILLEAGHPDNPWVQDLTHSATVKLSGGGIDGHYSYSISDEPTARTKIRTLMRSKYGWRDSWIALLFDTSQSRLPRLGMDGISRSTSTTRRLAGRDYGSAHSASRVRGTT